MLCSFDGFTLLLQQKNQRGNIKYIFVSFQINREKKSESFKSQLLINLIQMHVYNNYKSVASVWSVEGEKLEHFLSEELKQFPERKASRPDVGFFGFVLGFFPQFVRFLTRGYTPQRSHRSHTAVKLLSPGHIYAGVITKARWQVADRWWIDGLCPWVWTAPTWPVHQKHNNTVGGCCRVTHTSSKPKDTGASGGLFWNWMVITH